VPQGSTGTFIRLITPPGAHTDEGLDAQYEIDFTQATPVFNVRTPVSSKTIGFPTITVVDNVVTVSTSLG
jgi:hypothetical protein